MDLRLNQRTMLLKLRDGEAPPIIFIHPIGGTLFIYKKLINSLQTTSLVYGIQDDFQQKYQSIKQQAQFYLEQLFEELIPEELILIGQSSGGTLAQEMAYQCIQQGIKVKKLIMFDTWVKAPFDEDFKNYFEKIIERQMLKINANQTSIDIEAQNFMIDKMWERMNLIFEHTPSKTPVETALFTAIESVAEYKVDPETQYNWEPFVRSVDKIAVYGNHETMLDEQHIAELAMKLNIYVK